MGPQWKHVTEHLGLVSRSGSVMGWELPVVLVQQIHCWVDGSCCVMMPLLEQLSYNCVAYCACQWHLAVVVRSQWVGVVSLLSTSTVEVPCVLYQQGRAEQS